MKLCINLLLLCICMNFTYAQFSEFSNTDKSTTTEYSIEKKKKKSFFSKRIAPISIIAGGILLSTSKFEKSFQENIRDYTGDDFYLDIDDYTRYAPIVQMYSADILGVKSKNHWFDQTKNLALSSLLANGVTTLLKKEFDKPRPGDPNQLNSFPSGHTTMAFVSAAVLYEEFKDTSPVLAYSGYLFAATTGSLRILNNKHYLSDVLVGAGIGVLSTQLVYHFDNIIDWNPFKKSKDIAFVPQYDGEAISLYMVKQF